MGLFGGKKKTTDTQAAVLEQRFMDENFREELRNHARLYFDKVIEDNGQQFKVELGEVVTNLQTEMRERLQQQLDTVVAEMRTEIMEHTTKQINEQLSAYSGGLKAAQDKALQSLLHSAKQLDDQYAQLASQLQEQSNADSATVKAALEEGVTRISALKEAQNLALQSLAKSSQEMHEQYQQLESILEGNVKKQEDRIVDAFAGNMAQIVEQYLLEALGDQFDVKAQLPAILKQMEQNKQAMTDDMKL